VYIYMCAYNISIHPLCTHIVQRAISTATGLVLHTRDGCENVSCNPPPKKSVGWRLVFLFSLFIFRCREVMGREEEEEVLWPPSCACGCVGRPALIIRQVYRQTVGWRPSVKN
jgi:hypothetical protein